MPFYSLYLAFYVCWLYLRQIFNQTCKNHKLLLVTELIFCRNPAMFMLKEPEWCELIKIHHHWHPSPSQSTSVSTSSFISPSLLVGFACAERLLKGVWRPRSPAARICGASGWFGETQNQWTLKVQTSSPLKETNMGCSSAVLTSPQTHEPNQKQNQLYCQVCLHRRGICFSDRSSTVWQKDSDKWQIDNVQNSKNTIYKIDNYVLVCRANLRCK